MLIDKKVLGLLARVTAVNASERLRSSRESYKTPFAMRNTLINEIATRYKAKQTMGEFYTKIFPVSQ